MASRASDADTVEDDAGRDMPLSAAFAKARALFHKSTKGELSDKGRHEAVKLLSTCLMMVEHLGLFSTNEDLEDVSTADLKYLLAPYFLADLLASSPSKSMQERLGQVNAALTHYRQFLDGCHQYELLGSCASVYQREEEGLKINPDMRREIKISWFKRQKELKAQLQTFEAAAMAEPASTFKAGNEESAPSATGRDEDDERRDWLLYIELSVIRALEARPALKLEAEMLEMRAQVEARATPQQRAAEAQRVAEQEATKRAMMAKLHSVMSQLDGSKRQQLARDVLRPTHTLPTITVEEAGEIEYRQMVEREAASARREQEQAAADALLTKEELEDREVGRQRAMDDFKDANPRGWGNSKLRPCG